MDLQKINVKFFLEKGADLTLASFIPLFHRWIQGNKLEGLLIDVAEYTHVHQGPGILLIAHEANYSLDEAEGKRGFLYNQKRTGEKNAEAHLKMAFKRVLSACALLEKEPEAAGKLKFAMNRVQVCVNDRLEASSGSKSLAGLEEALKPFLGWLYDGGKCMFMPEQDPRRRTGFEVKIETGASIETLLQKLNTK